MTKHFFLSNQFAFLIKCQEKLIEDTESEMDSSPEESLAEENDEQSKGTKMSSTSKSAPKTNKSFQLSDITDNNIRQWILDGIKRDRYDNKSGQQEKREEKRKSRKRKFLEIIDTESVE